MVIKSISGGSVLYNLNSKALVSTTGILQLNPLKKFSFFFFLTKLVVLTENVSSHKMARSAGFSRCYSLTVLVKRRWTSPIWPSVRRSQIKMAHYARSDRVLSKPIVAN